MPAMPNSENGISSAIGREVATLVDDELKASEHAVTFDGVKLPSGVYFYQLRAGELSQVRKAILMK